MLGEQQPIIPNLSSAPPPNANPNPPLMSTYQHVPTVIHSRQLVYFQPFECEVCNTACDTRDVLEKHKVGKKHLQNMKKLAMLEKHKVGKKHLKNMKKLASSSSIASEMAPQQPPDVGSETSIGELENKKHKLLQNGAFVDTLIYCHICNVVCNNQDLYQSHVAGKRHSAKAAIQLAFSNGASNTKAECGSQTLQLLWCELCKISCTSNELLNLHLAGKKHLKNLFEMENLENRKNQLNQTLPSLLNQTGRGQKVMRMCRPRGRRLYKKEEYQMLLQRLVNREIVAIKR